ncbi:hypothetical protein L914_20757, partial [Phytophthora nicotianae]
RTISEVFEEAPPEPSHPGQPQTAQNLHHQWDDRKIDACDRSTLGIGGQNQQIRRNLHTEP